MIATDLPVADIHRCAADAEFVRQVAGLYDELDRRIESQNPICTNRGSCCRFVSFDHHLFVTSTELAFFLAHHRKGLLAPPDRSFCPYQQEGRCTARAARPAGCRIFHCDPHSQHWQPDTSEWVLNRFREIGAGFDLPYAYVEWTMALRRLGGAIVAEADPGGLLIQIDTQMRQS